MTNPTWPIGPARCRNDEYEAEILATDMGGFLPILIRIRKKGFGEWDTARIYASGREYVNKDSIADLLPPKLTRDEAIAECVNKYYEPHLSQDGHENAAMVRAITHWEKLKAEGRIDD